MAKANDTFAAGGDTAIGSWTPTGPDAGSGYTVIGGAVIVLAATGEARDNNTSNGNRVRMNNDLGSDEMDVYGTFRTNAPSGQALGPGLAGRMSSGGGVGIEFTRDQFTNSWLLDDNAGNTNSLVESFTASTPFTMKLEIRTGSIKGYVNGVEKVSLAVNTKSGNTRAGFLLLNFGGGNAWIDNYQSVGLNKGYRLTASPASLALTGQSVTLKRSSRIAVTAGSLALAGQSVTLKRSSKIAVTPGSLSLTGQSVNLLKGVTLTVNPGALALTGQSVNLKTARRIAVTPGSLALAGQSVTLKRSTRIAVNPGSLALAGQSVTLKRSTRIAVTPGALTLAGQSVTLKRSSLIAVTPGALTLAGQSVTLKRSSLIAVTPGTLALNGQSVNLIYTPVGASYTLTVDPGAIALTGQSVTLKRSTRIAVTPGAISLTGQSATLRRSNYIGVTPGSLLLSGQSVTLTVGGGTPALIYTSNFPFTRARSSTNVFSRTSGSVRLVTTANGDDELVP